MTHLIKKSDDERWNLDQSSNKENIQYPLFYCIQGKYFYFSFTDKIENKRVVIYQNEIGERRLYCKDFKRVWT